MRKALIAIMVGGAFVLTSVGALAQTSSPNGLEARGEAALDALQQARENCFDTLHQTFEDNPVTGSKSNKDAAKAALATARKTVNDLVVPALTALDTALDNFEDEDGVVTGATALQTATLAAENATKALNETFCPAANKALKDTLTELAKSNPPDDEDEADDDSGSAGNHTHGKVETKSADRD